MRTPGTVRRAVAATVLAFACASVLSGCGDKTKTLTWWGLPDRVGAEALARQCSDIGDGYRIEVRTLPSSLSGRRADLIRRLSAHDRDIDILTLDSALTAEFAAAEFLAPVPKDLQSRTGLIAKAVEAATYQGKLVAVPWWIDPQMLWFRGAAAERAGIDTTKPVSWDTLLDGANRIRASVEFDDADGSGMADWVRGLVAESGGYVMQGTGRTPKVGLGGEAGRVAAGIVEFYASSGLGDGPDDGALTEFAGSHGAFLVARASARTDPDVVSVAADMRPLRYPIIAGTSVAPLSGAALAVPAVSNNRKAAFDAIACLSSAESEVEVMRNSGRGAARQSVYSVASVRKVVPYAETLLAAAQAGVNVPSSPHWHRAEGAIRMAWTPIGGVRAKSTPKASAGVVRDAVGGGLR